MPDGKTGGSRWVPDIRPDEIGTFQEKYGDTTATYKAVNVHPIINRVLDKLAFFRTHAAAVWYNKLAGQTVADKFGEVDTALSALNAKTEYSAQGIQVVKIGKVVTMQIVCSSTTYSQTGWNNIAVLPEEFKPAFRVDMALTDNLAANPTEMTAVLGQVNRDCTVQVYVYVQKTTMAPRGSVTYITD